MASSSPSRAWLGALAAFTAGATVGCAIAWRYLSRPGYKPKVSLSNAWLAGSSEAFAGRVDGNGKSSTLPTISKALADGPGDDIVREHLTRNVQFFGLEGQRRIAGAFVVVVGLGGVGSHAAHLLLRSGVGRLRLVDFDQVTLSSLNRHCLATRRDVGLSKSEVLARHFREIMPEAQVEDMRCMYTLESEEEVLSGPVDFVLDAIDNIDTKIALLAACKARGLPVLASAGAGAKADPTRLRVVDISESVADPLARAVRHRLRRDHDLASGVPVLLSTERPRCGLVYGGEEGADPLEFQVVPGFRVRTIPVLGTMPAVFGLAAASWILCQLAGAPYEPEPVFSLDSKQIQTQWDRLDAREASLRATGVGVGGGKVGEGSSDASTLDDFADDSSIQPLIDLAEVRCLVRELWRGRSARSPLGSNLKGMGRALGDLCLCRWELHRPPVPHNLVLLTKAEADAHEAQGGYTPEMRQREPALCEGIERVLRRARLEFQEGRYM